MRQWEWNSSVETQQESPKKDVCINKKLYKIAISIEKSGNIVGGGKGGGGDDGDYEGDDKGDDHKDRDEFDDVDDENPQHENMKMDTQYDQQGKVSGSRDHGLSEMLQDGGYQIQANEDEVVLLKQML
jgi:hypothetical protein